MKTLSALSLLGAAAGALCLTAPARAVTLYSSLSDWETAAGVYAETSNFGALSGAAINGFVTGDGVSVSVHEKVQQVGETWGTWSSGYTGEILANFHSTSVPFVLGTAVSAFGFFAEPDDAGTFDITLTTSDDSVLTQSVYFDGGAAFFGWTGAGISSFTVSSTDNFGVGEFFTATSFPSVPEPATWAMVLVGFGGSGAALRRHRRRGAGVNPRLK